MEGRCQDRDILNVAGGDPIAGYIGRQPGVTIFCARCALPRSRITAIVDLDYLLYWCGLLSDSSKRKRLGRYADARCVLLENGEDNIKHNLTDTLLATQRDRHRVGTCLQTIGRSRERQVP